MNTVDTLTFRELSGPSSPIDRLPNELILEIFFHHPSLTSAIAAKLASVCVRWHDLAHTTPELWCWVHFDFKNNKQPPLLCVEQWLERSRNELLYITIFTDFDPPKFNLEGKIEYIRHVLRLFVTHIRRWKCLKVWILHRCYGVAFQDFPSLHDAFALTTLRMHINDQLGNDRNLISAIATAPRLKELTFYSVSAEPIWTVAPSTFPWSNLTFLEFTGSRGWDSMLYIVTRCTSVVKLKLQAATSIEEFPGPLPSSIDLPHLKTLIMKTYSLDALKVLSKFNSPNLRVLHLTFNGMDLIGLSEIVTKFLYLVNFIKSNKHRIMILKLDTCHPLSPQVIQLLFLACISKAAELMGFVELSILARDGWLPTVHSITNSLNYLTPEFCGVPIAPIHVDDRERDGEYGKVRVGWFNPIVVKLYFLMERDADLDYGMKLLNLELVGPKLHDVIGQYGILGLAEIPRKVFFEQLYDICKLRPTPILANGCSSTIA